MANFPGPYEVRINYRTVYNSQFFDHQLRISCSMDTPASVGDPFSSWLADKKDGGTIALNTWVDGLVALLRPLIRTDGSFLDAELWEYTPGTFDASWRSSYSIALAGTGAAATVAASQLIFTFRTTEGGSARVNVLGTVTGFGPSTAYPTGTATWDDVFEYIADAATIAKGRDNGFIAIPLRFHPGQNEALFKKIFRS